jgi:DNA-binding response OmpR family regulator
MTEPLSIGLVEDDTILSFVMTKYIEKMGRVCAFVAKKGDEAVRLAKEYNPGIILMDLNLEGSYDGVEAANRIREFWAGPIIFLTGNSDGQSLDRIRSLPGARWLIKPVDFFDLQAYLNALESEL